MSNKVGILNIDLSQEDAAVLDAIHQVRESTGYGKVVVEIKEGHVRLIEVSTTVLIRRNHDKIEENAHEA